MSREQPSITMLRVEQIDIDVDWYPRGGYVPDHVKMMRETLAAFPEKELPPIIVTADFKLIDGLHRTYAYKEFGRDKIPAFVQNGLGENEAWELALRLNNENSTPISFEDRRLVFERMWKHHLKAQKHPVAHLVELFRVSSKTVTRWVDEIEAPKPTAKPIRPSAPKRMSMEPARPLNPTPKAEPSPSTPTRVVTPSPESLTKSAFDGLRVAATYAMSDEVSAEGICAIATSLEDAQRSLFLTSIRTGLTKVLRGLEQFYKKDLKREPPWK